MSKHEQISRELRGEIAAGKYATDQPLPSEAQLVSRFGVSRPTVARALRDLQSEGLIRRRAGAGTFVTQRSGEDTQTAVLGLLVPERGLTEIFESICGELAALARVHGFGLLWGSSPLPYKDRDASPEHALRVCHLFIEKGVSGVFFAPLEYEDDRESINLQVLSLLSQAGIPVVLLDRDVVHFPQRSPFDLVCIDNFTGGFILGQHLIRLGCRRIRFVSKPGSASSVDARLSGVREAMIQHERGFDDSLLATGDPGDKEFIRKLRPGFECDAIIGANDATARMLIEVLTALQVRIPQQVRVVGFDDVRAASLTSVPLTTVRQPLNEIAEIAFRAILGRIREPGIPPRSITLQPRLVIRESCGTYLAS